MSNGWTVAIWGEKGERGGRGGGEGEKEKELFKLVGFITPILTSTSMSATTIAENSQFSHEQNY